MLKVGILTLLIVLCSGCTVTVLDNEISRAMLACKNNNGLSHMKMNSFYTGLATCKNGAIFSANHWPKKP